MEIHHQPVFLNPLLQHVLQPDDRYVLDATLGEGGHSLALLERGLSVWAIERDRKVQAKAEMRLQQWLQVRKPADGQEDLPKITIFGGNFGDVNLEVYLQNQISFDVAIFDLGVSKFHYFESGRGFSFHASEPLDMRLDKDAAFDAAYVVNQFSQADLADVFYRYGEMTNARVMAAHICRLRKEKPIHTAKQFADAVAAGPHFQRGKNHPATTAFQALRLFVNKELDCIADGLTNAIRKMAPGGRVVAISYHSLEDRIVKKTFNSMLVKRENKNKYRSLKSHNEKAEMKKRPPNGENTNANDLKMQDCRLWRKKVVVADRQEVKQNRAARSAKMRVLIVGKKV